MTDALNQMEREIVAQPALADALGPAFRERLHDLIPSEAVAPIERVHLVGCGDSHQAGLATTLAFGQWAGLPAEAHQALEFTGYRAPLVGPRDLVIPISNSGRVARTVEAAVMARARGARVIAITGNPDGPLARECGDALITNTASSVGVTPGTHSFLASMIAAWSIAQHLSAASYPSGKGAGGLGPHLTHALDVARALPSSLLDLLDSGVPPHVLGAGPAHAIALYAQMKFLESAAVTAMPFELEEWAHAGFFLATERTPVLIFAPEGESLARARELVRAPLALGAPVIAFVPAGSESEWHGVHHVIPVPPNLPEALAPAALALPIQWLALGLARRRAATPLGFDDSARRDINFEQIFDSEIRREPPTWK